MNTSLKTILDSAEFNAFLTAAKSFCNFIETSTLTGREFLFASQDLLIELYRTAIKLTDAGVADSHESIDIPDEEYKKILKSIGQRQPFQYYWIALNPIIEGEYKYDEGVGDVTDDVAEIYRELKPALLLLESDSEDDKTNAVWELKFGFDNHWNDHCINALHATHHYLEKHKYDE
jgi:hypothetical protein